MNSDLVERVAEIIKANTRMVRGCEAMVTLTLFANIYSTSLTDLYATINDAGMWIERYGV